MLVAVTGCDTTQPNQRAGAGALIGAGAGALAGQAIGRDTKSTVIGAAGGALLGAAAGAVTAPKQQPLCRYRGSDGNIYEAPCEQRY
jgi:outer membrane lipoprotein SlyB